MPSRDMYRTGSDKSTDFRVFKDANQVAMAAADYLFNQITACVVEKGSCRVVLPGGNTPAQCLEILADKPLPWDKVHWYPSDERCLPRGHEDRNDSMIYRCLFTRPDSVVENFHPIPAELGAQRAATEYADFIDQVGPIDIAFLGVGEDGHTASLFPENLALDDNGSIVAVLDSPKPPTERVSFGLQALRYADESVLIATGSSKRDALARLQFGESSPVTMIEPDVCFADDAAYGQ